jgi:hypothetical protein
MSFCSVAEKGFLLVRYRWSWILSELSNGIENDTLSKASIYMTSYKAILVLSLSIVLCTGCDIPFIFVLLFFTVEENLSVLERRYDYQTMLPWDT